MSLSYIYSLLSFFSIPLIILFGVIGNLLSILIFTRPSLRRSCSIYFLVGSVNCLVILLFGALTRWLSIGYINFNPTTTSLFYCRFRSYFVYVIYNLSPYFTACITIDRFCSSSSSASIRRLSSRIKLAYMVVLMVILITFIAYSHMLVGFTVVNSVCQAQSGFYAEFFPFFTTGYYFFSIVLIIFFGFGTSYNIRSQRRKVRAIRVMENRQIRGDTQLLLLLFVHVICYISLALPYHISLVIGATYPTLLVNPKFQFIQNLTIILLYLSQAINFYAFTLTANLYRKELFNLLRKVKTKYWDRQPVVHFGQNTVY
ncbi:unnamed protein product [Adineta ricciae]|uniref:G-protein coupled receptors family 1 profile domain-containing protein n=2 Tax=Adineta ricciae TaxID=249248 RepID=A0A815K1B2_ADIRI|nr:unnamed protein product [Adineta ricciae]